MAYGKEVEVLILWFMFMDWWKRERQAIRNYIKGGSYCIEYFVTFLIKTQRMRKRYSSIEYETIAAQYKESNDYRNAIKYQKKAIKLNPHNEKHHYNLGVMYKNAGKKKKAVSSYKRAISINPEYPLPYLNLGDLYFSLGNFKSAVHFLKKAIENGKKSPAILIKIGDAHADLKEFDQALSKYTEAIKLDANNIDAYNNMGLVYLDLNQFDNAIECFKSALSIDYAADILNNFGIAYFKKGDHQKAINSLNNAIRESPDYGGAYYNLAKVYADLDQDEKMIEMMIMAAKYNCSEAIANLKKLRIKY